MSIESRLAELEAAVAKSQPDVVAELERLRTLDRLVPLLILDVRKLLAYKKQVKGAAER